MSSRIKRVVLESPYAGEIVANVAYAWRAAHACALRGEATVASHLYYTMFLDDTLPNERALGIELGLAWREVADYSVFFVDRGWSRGMLEALKRLVALRPRGVFYVRSLDGPVKWPLHFPLDPRNIEHLIDCEAGVWRQP